MVDIKIEHRDKILILNISGTISFADVIMISKTYIPEATCHILFNLNDSTMDETVTYKKLSDLPNFIKGHKSKRDPNGKSAHVSSNSATFGMLNMVSSVISGSSIQHDQKVFKSIDEALKWLAE